MRQNCNCPISFNITVGVFLIALAIASWISIWSISMPFWMEILILLLGIAAIWLNTANRANVKVKNLTTEEANQLHAEEGL